MKKRAPTEAKPGSEAGKVLAFPGFTPGIRPLTARTKEGEPYTRFDEVQRQIERLASASPSTWPGIVGQGLDGHSVKNEALVYLIRQAWRNGHDKELIELHSALFDRMATMITNRAARMGIDDAEPLVEAVQNRIIAVLYSDPENPAADVFEVAFNLVVSREIQKWNRKHGKYWQRLDLR